MLLTQARRLIPPCMNMTYLRGVCLYTCALALLILGSLGTVNSAIADEKEVWCGTAQEFTSVVGQMRLMPVFQGISPDGVYVMRLIRQTENGPVEYQVRVDTTKQDYRDPSSVGCLYEMN